jgi:ATP-dependent RNA circularization protein (DNA/RNA ligase family)
MNEYHKIQTVFLRDPATNHKTLLEGQWAKPEFEFLKDAKWQFTEKIDGTNIRVMWDGLKVRFGGKTDNAQIPTYLLAKLQDTFTEAKLTAQFGDHMEMPSVCLYGEGFGAKIQKGGGNYISDGVDFILFDVKVGDWWLEWESVTEVANALGLRQVPIVGEGTLLDAVEVVRAGFGSTIGTHPHIAEGLIMKPATTLFNRKGERVISKLKHKDFAKAEAAR